jgi:FlaA1/EpsC-like NDP-sugar epimerase
MTFLESFRGKRIIMTGATGGVGSKIAKKLLKQQDVKIVMLV